MGSTHQLQEARYKGKLINVIGDEDTCVGFLLGGIGEMNKNTRRNNFLVVTKSTTTSEIEECFKRFVKSPDVSIILISQHVAQSIRNLIDSHQAPSPVVLEIPTKDHPYDPSTDIILERAEHLFNPEA